MNKDAQFSLQTGNSCSLISTWWLIALRGIFSILFGIMALFLPSLTILAITLVFGAYAVATGVFYLVSGLHRAYEGRTWGSLTILGFLGITVGLIVLIIPQIVAISLTTLFWVTLAFWSIATGALELAAANRIRQEINGEWFMTFSGIISIIFGIALMALFLLNPAASMVTLGLLIGISALFSGVLLFLFALRLRRLANY